MKETLYIRLTASAPDALTDYCVATTQNQHSWTVQNAPMSEVLAKASHRRVVVFVAGSEVRLTRVTLPGRGARLLQAVPYALEEQFAEDVDSLHFSLGTRLADGSYPVAVVAQKTMQSWIELFQQHGAQPDVLVPEILCLPATDAEHWSGVAEVSPEKTGHVSVRTGESAGFSCSDDDFALLLQLAAPQGGHKPTLRLAIAGQHAPDFTALDWPLELLPGFGSALEVLLHHYRPQLALNLMQGPYAQSEGLRKLWQPWRMAASLAAAWIVVAGASHGVHAYSLGKQARAQDAQNEERFRALFPGENRIVDIAAQTEQQAAALNGGAQANSFLALSEVLAKALPNAGLKLLGIQYRERALYVSLGGDDLQELERLREWFAQQPHALLEVQSASSGADGAQIRVKVSAR